MNTDLKGFLFLSTPGKHQEVCSEWSGTSKLLQCIRFVLMQRITCNSMRDVHTAEIVLLSSFLNTKNFDKPILMYVRDPLALSLVNLFAYVEKTRFSFACVFSCPSHTSSV